MIETTFQVTEIIQETPEVKRFVLASLDGSVLDWQAGAHVRVALPAGGDRAYSLLDLPDLAADQIALGVLLEGESTGGSSYMHGVQVGDKLQVKPAENHFVLEAGEDPIMLLAGGIGITPILSMAAELRKAGRAFQAHYCGRTEGALAFVSDMQSICGDALHLHYDDQDSALNIAAMLREVPKGAHLYICGPGGLIDAVKAEAAAQGWNASRIHFELFSNSAAEGEDTAFDVEIHDTGQIVHVPADKSIIEALEAAGLDPLYDCQRGDCGICQCDVIDGIPDHRDVILSDSEKATNSVMQICVSRAKSTKLVLDL